MKVGSQKMKSGNSIGARNRALELSVAKPDPTLLKAKNQIIGNLKMNLSGIRLRDIKKFGVTGANIRSLEVGLKMKTLYA